MTRREQPGTCDLCGHRTVKTAMTRHLGRCVSDSTGGSAARSAGRPGTLIHLQVDAGPGTPWWLHVEIDGRALLQDLDLFLRRIWLECCGHGSELRIGRARYLPEEMLDDWYPDARSMSVPVAEAVKALDTRRRTIHYTYDFGSPTELRLRVVGQRPGSLPLREPVLILARNEPEEWRCGQCGATATLFCTGCADPFYCRAHARRHGCDDAYGAPLLPVVDSPRMGMCAYTGPPEPMPPARRQGRRGRTSPKGRSDLAADG